MKEFAAYWVFIVAALCFLRFVRVYRPDMAVLSSLGLVVFLTGASLSVVLPVIEYVDRLASAYATPYVSLLWKGLAIALLTSTSADLCRSAEEEAVAQKVELFGKCELLLLSLPLIQEITALIETLAGDSL